MTTSNEYLEDLLNTIIKRLDELEDAVGSGNRILLRRLDELEDTVGSRLDRLEDSIRDEINKEK